MLSYTEYKSYIPLERSWQASDNGQLTGRYGIQKGMSRNGTACFHKHGLASLVETVKS